MVDIKNSELNEQVALISQLDEEERNALIKIINSMLTNVSVISELMKAFKPLFARVSGICIKVRRWFVDSIFVLSF